MKLTGGQIVVEALAKEGVPYIAGIPGRGTLGLSDALVGQDRVKVIQVRHEQAAVHLADGYYRASGLPLAAFTCAGPGALNTAIGLASCYVDGIPVLVFVGNSQAQTPGKGSRQEIGRAAEADSLAVLAPLAKRTWRATSAVELPRILQRAFAEMLTGRRGPVVVELPLDVQSEDGEVGTGLPESETYRPSGRVEPEAILVQKAARQLLEANRPVLVAGGGVITAEAWVELRELAELLGAPVVTTMMGKGAFPEDHPLSGLHAGSRGTTCGNALTRSADVLLAVGTRFAEEGTSSYRHGMTYSIPPTHLIQMDLDPAEIGKNYPVEVGIVADAQAGLAALIEAIRTRKSSQPPAVVRQGYLVDIRRLREEWLAQVQKLASSDHKPVTTSRLIAELRALLKRDAIVLTSSGATQTQWFQETMIYEPRTNLTTGGLSTMGWTVPAAMGAKLAAPGRQVMGLLGDGDFLMTAQELATAAQYNLPVVYVVANNAGWISIRDLQTATYGRERAVGAEFLRGWGQPSRNRDRASSILPSSEPHLVIGAGRAVSPDLAALARAYGCYAEWITNPDEVRPALERALAANRPAVLEVMVEREQ
jgi:acetolactate synthase-1/2/3 large subunit